jgi:hypothetical protein
VADLTVTDIQLSSSGESAGRRVRQFAIVSLFAGLFSLRATLTKPLGRGFYAACQGWTYQKVTWRRDFTLALYERGCYTPAENAHVVFIIVTVCGTIMTLYGAMILFRHGPPGVSQ